jgi:predicted PurR-regulated permease PerM
MIKKQENTTIHNETTDSVNDDTVRSTSPNRSTRIHKNRFLPDSKYYTILVYSLLFVFCSILIYKFVGNFNGTLSLIGKIISLISPFIVGAFIAFILYPLVKFLYHKVFMDKFHVKSCKAAKYLSITFAYLFAIGIITILIVFIAPQIYDSLSEITEQLPIWYNNAVAFVHTFENNHTDWTFIDYDMINTKLESAFPLIMDYLSKIMTNLLPLIFNTSMLIVKGIINFIISIMVSVYMISDHKNLFYHTKRMIYALLPKSAADTTRKIIRESSHIFSSFIFGKALDSLIIGIICFICMLILRLPYAVLISVIVGITNMIPYFGPYIGGIMGGIVIIIVSPVKVIIFAILILVIQQFDGLYLGPKILGESTGLKPLWVIFSITIGGSLFGVLGMFLGVPCVAVIGYILHLIIEHFLHKRNIEITPYESPDEM